MPTNIVTQVNGRTTVVRTGDGISEARAVIAATESQNSATAAAASAAAVQPYANRAAAVAALSGLASSVTRIGWRTGAQVVEVVRETGATAIADMAGWTPTLPARAHSWNLVGDDATDNTAAFEAMRAYCSATGWPVVLDRPGGVYRYNGISMGSGQKLILEHRGLVRPVLKLAPGANSNLFNTSHITAVLDVSGFILDQNGANQSAGHGVRSAGAAVFRVRNCEVINSFGYGIGLQGGTTVETLIENVRFKNIQSDCIDVKDLEGNNGLVVVRNIYATEWGLNLSNDAVVDIRGPAHVTDVHGDGTVNCVVLRLRPEADGEGGRAGYGRFANISGKRVVSESAQVQVFSCASENPNWVLNGLHGEDVFNLFGHTSTARGGTIIGATATRTFGDGASLGGDGLTVIGMHVDTTDTGARAFDVEPTARRNRITGLSAGMPNANVATAGRIQAGAEDTHISGQVRLARANSGGVNGIADAGTRSDLTSVTAFTSQTFYTPPA